MLLPTLPDIYKQQQTIHRSLICLKLLFRFIVKEVKKTLRIPMQSKW